MCGPESFVGDALVQIFVWRHCVQQFAPPNFSLFLKRIFRRTSINHDKSLGMVVVLVFNFEKAHYFAGLPNNNEMELICVL